MSLNREICYPVFGHKPRYHRRRILIEVCTLYAIFDQDIFQLIRQDYTRKKYQKLLKSDNFDIKYETAVDFYNNTKYSRALTLFEDILSEFS